MTPPDGRLVWITREQRDELAATATDPLVDALAHAWDASPTPEAGYRYDRDADGLNFEDPIWIVPRVEVDS